MGDFYVFTAVGANQRWWGLASALGLAIVGPWPARAQEAAKESTQMRSTENAVKQAEDAFGLSVGRETLGVYSDSNVRGFSPLAAGNTRIDGLYFDQYLRPITRIRQSTTVRVGLSAQGYIFPAPTGVVDYALRHPGEKARLSVLAAGDSLGTASIEADGQMPLSDTVSVGGGAFVGTQRFYNGTRNHSHNEGLELRWRPSPSIDIMPFWTRSEIHDQTGPLYIPAGAVLPPPIPRNRFGGPKWLGYDGVGGVYGVVGSIDIAASTRIRFGGFHSYYSDKRSSSNLLQGVQPDGSYLRQLAIIDPPSRYVSNSGEIRLSHSFSEATRLHLINLTLRARDRRQRYSGSAIIDLGPGRIGDRITTPEPPLTFSAQSKDHIRQYTFGAAYQLRWSGVGEAGFGVQRTNYSKILDRPGNAQARDTATPSLLYAFGTLNPFARIAIYGSYTQGLEESGVAPDRAVNRGQPVPAIRTHQVDGGLRWTIRDGLKLVAGAFDLEKPYFNLDANNQFIRLGDLRNRGVELSLAGSLTDRLNVVTGAILADPQVMGEARQLGRVGARPVNVPRQTITINADWRLPGVEGVSLDGGATRQSRIFATTDNAVIIPGRTIVNVGGRYRFLAASKPATLRVSVSNIGDVRGFSSRGSGTYDIIQQRTLSAYLTVDL